MKVRGQWHTATGHVTSQTTSAIDQFEHWHPSTPAIGLTSSGGYCGVEHKMSEFAQGLLIAMLCKTHKELYLWLYGLTMHAKSGAQILTK